MDNCNDSHVSSISFDDVPRMMLVCAERVDILTKTIDVIKGWSPDVARMKELSIFHIVNASRNLKTINHLIGEITSDIAVSKERMQRLSLIKQRLLHIANNLPQRFNKLEGNDLKTTRTQSVSSVSDGQCIVQSSLLPTVVRSAPPGPPNVTYLSLEEYENCPKYLKGRIPYEKINGMVDLFNNVLKKKYTILSKKKSTLKKIDADRFTTFKRQEAKETTGMFFCVLDDFKSLGGTALDKTSLNILNILRHCGRLREVRTGGFVRYMATF